MYIFTGISTFYRFDCERSICEVSSGSYWEDANVLSFLALIVGVFGSRTYVSKNYESFRQHYISAITLYYEVHIFFRLLHHGMEEYRVGQTGQTSRSVPEEIKLSICVADAHTYI